MSTANTDSGNEVNVLRLTLHGRLVGYLAGFSNGRNILKFCRRIHWRFWPTHIQPDYAP